jgi:hypothetical protein
MVAWGDAMRLVSQVPLLVPPWGMLGGTTNTGRSIVETEPDSSPCADLENVGCRSTAGKTCESTTCSVLARG